MKTISKLKIQFKVNIYNLPKLNKIFRNAVLARRPTTVLNHAQKMPGFDEAFKKLTFKKVQKEADDAAKRLNESGPREFTRAELKSFEADKYFERLREEAPLIMTTLGGICSRQKYSEMEVK